MKNIFYVGLFFLFISCKTSNVAVDYDRNTDFNIIKTYNYSLDNSVQLNQLDSANFVRILEQTLHAKRLVKSKNPDILVTLQVYNQTGNKINTVNLGIGGGNRWLGVGTGIGIPIRKKVMDYVVQMDFNDVHSNNLIWTGSVMGTTSYGATSDAKDSFFRKQIQNLLKKYPPDAKKTKKSNYYN